MDPLTWLDEAACTRRDPTWWDTGNRRNRDAIRLCQTCPVAGLCAASETAPRGVIRNGVAYTATGHVAALCGCGQPIHQPRVGATQCTLCNPSHTGLPDREYQRKAPNGAVDRHWPTIMALHRWGMSDRQIGERIGARPNSVRAVRRRRGLTTPKVAAA